jgi:hypothetical protein
MEQVFKKSEVEAIIKKAILSGKISATEYYLSYIKKQLQPVQEWIQILENKGEFMTESWFECQSKIGTLSEIQGHLADTQSELEKRIAALNND